MQLVLTDATMKIGVLRSAFPGAQVVAVDFPLYHRFSKTGKVKFDSWPKLKPAAKAKIESIIAQASKCSSVIAVFDNSQYGRSLARDVREALSAVNARVSFLFPDILAKDDIRCCDNSDFEENPDTEYVIDRIIATRMNALLADVLPQYADIELTRQQAYVLSSIYGSASDCTSLSFTDAVGRVWTGSPGKIDKETTSFKKIQLSVEGFPIYKCHTVSLERMWHAVDKLQAQGCIPTNECRMSVDAFDRWRSYLSSNGLTPKSIRPSETMYWVDDPNFSPEMIVDEIAARPLYRWLRSMTMSACLEQHDMIEMMSNAGCLTFKGLLDQEESWAALADIKTFPPYETQTPRHDLSVLDCKFVSADTIYNDCKGLLSQREVWSALLRLHRNNLIRQYNSSFYPTSRGVTAVLALKEVFPIALGSHLSKSVQDMLNQSDAAKIESINAIFTDYSSAKDLSMWDTYTQRKATLSVSKTSAFFMTKSGNFCGLALADGKARVIRSGLELNINCKCGSTVVKTHLDSTYEPFLKCPECDKEYPLMTMKQMESPNET